MLKCNEPVGLAQLKSSALHMLARREYSRSELAQKLSLKYQSAPIEDGADFGDLLSEVLNKLIDLGLQDDSRFAEAYINYRLRRGFGPERIFLELRQKGIGDNTARPFLERVDSQDNIRRVWKKKFSCYPSDTKAKVKQQQFLRYRGFSAEQIKILFDDLIS